ncbi:uncharacterized protein LOC116620223 [Nematostella vectensis]|uniref:uncharacterized protein LOC116620223 n=1 Tax=Nematostella vectensis TaxID=45351 RepID=UPI00207793D2|nr:uncharacterized protein LOC116620223 [Nematostella vectensis]
MADKMLAGHVITSLEMTSLLDCVDECLTEIRCKSINIKANTGAESFTCQLNNATKKSSSSGLVTSSEGFAYYDADKNPHPSCASLPCRNGGLCADSCESDSYTCVCGYGTQGKHCEKWSEPHLESRLDVQEAGVKNYAEVSLTFGVSNLTICFAVLLKKVASALFTFEDENQNEILSMVMTSRMNMEINIRLETRCKAIATNFGRSIAEADDLHFNSN